MTNVFVYGTLRWGEGNHRLLARAKHLADGKTIDRFLLVNLGAFPAVIVGSNPGPSQIVGEVYDVDCQTLHRLDGLEGYPNFYDRGEVAIETEAGELVAWMYYLRPEGQRCAEVIPSGDWKDRTRQFTNQN